MTSLIFLLCATFVLSVSSYKILNYEDVINVKKDLKHRHEDVLKNIDEQFVDIFGSYLIYTNIEKEINSTLRNANETLFKDLYFFEDIDIAKVIEDQDSECFALSKNYKETKNIDFMKYSSCLMNVNNTILNEIKKVEEMCTTNKMQLLDVNIENSCTISLDTSITSSQLSELTECLTKLTEKIDVCEENLKKGDNELITLFRKVASTFSREILKCNVEYDNNQLQTISILENCLFRK